MKLVFESRGSTVYFKNPFFLMGDESDEAPEEILCVCKPIDGNYGEILSSEKVAQALVLMLNNNDADTMFRKAADLI